MLYIHRTTCISPQQTFPEMDIDLSRLYRSEDNKLKAREPSYEAIPAGQLRRMGKTVRLGIGAAFPLLREAATPPSGILVGTANAGMEESIQFMKEIIDHEEGILSPGSFVRSTPNTIAAQLGLLSHNKAYNITHVQGGLAFENALIDAAMLVNEHPGSTFLVGAADEIGTHNYNIDRLQGWFKTEAISNEELYTVDSPGSLAGEGAAMFLVSDREENALAKLEAIAMMHSEEQAVAEDRLSSFLDQHLGSGEKIDLLMSGENGDSRCLHFFSACEKVLGKWVSRTARTPPAVVRFKHMCGEYPTASAFALWLGCRIMRDQVVPAHMIKNPTTVTGFERVLIYNNYKGLQHSFMLIHAQRPH
jgi:hypothetical protein